MVLQFCSGDLTMLFLLLPCFTTRVADHADGSVLFLFSPLLSVVLVLVYLSCLVLLQMRSPGRRRGGLLGAQLVWTGESRRNAFLLETRSILRPLSHVWDIV